MLYLACIWYIRSERDPRFAHSDSTVNGIFVIYWSFGLLGIYISSLIKIELWRSRDTYIKVTVLIFFSALSSSPLVRLLHRLYLLFAFWYLNVSVFMPLLFLILYHFGQGKSLYFLQVYIYCESGVSLIWVLRMIIRRQWGRGKDVKSQETYISEAKGDRKYR